MLVLLVRDSIASFRSRFDLPKRVKQRGVHDQRADEVLLVKR
jgi:hypothetical protein